MADAAPRGRGGFGREYRVHFNKYIFLTQTSKIAPLLRPLNVPHAILHRLTSPPPHTHTRDPSRIY